MAGYKIQKFSFKTNGNIVNGNITEKRVSSSSAAGCRKKQKKMYIGRNAIMR
jgi:hypothetical protein